MNITPILQQYKEQNSRIWDNTKHRKIVFSIQKASNQYTSDGKPIMISSGNCFGIGMTARKFLENKACLEEKQGFPVRIAPAKPQNPENHNPKKIRSWIHKALVQYTLDCKANQFPEAASKLLDEDEHENE